MTDQTTDQAELAPGRAAEMLESGDAQLVDVREAYEWEAGRVEGASHIPLATLPARATEIDSERPVILQCRTGARSRMATDALRASGYDAYNLEGGLERWVEDGLPLTPTDGTVATARPDNS
ncbi:MAG TPA: rhodanese-like domain-containing protein [Solirubrobacterales bacterium]|nr:rhodanese-like domain-containing protein [Solirubrobacterales bacterium]